MLIVLKILIKLNILFLDLELVHKIYENAK